MPPALNSQNMSSTELYWG